jgi:phosphopantothenoylcysteine decarboxylase / phosphopantothenate---cysteine ligase
MGSPRRVLLGITGGIAAYKAAHLARLLIADGHEVSVVMTENATRFVGPDTFAGLTGRPVYSSLWERSGEVLHVRLAHEADVAVVAPATANLLAKLAVGIADDLLSAILLEFDGPLVIAPAMHTGMWGHPATRSNVELLTARGVRFVGPVEGALAHGDEGMGRFAEPEAIAEEVRAAAGVATSAEDLAGRTIVVTAGPTHEPIDPVRYLGNRSTGKMGIAIASEAARRGAEVRLVLGPGTVPPPVGLTAIPVSTAEEMREVVLSALPGTDAVIMAAAVADFRPKQAASDKLKKDDGTPELSLEPTPDILQELGRRPDRPFLVAFAAETGDVVGRGREKLRRKGADLVVANEVGRAGTGFGAETNRAAILSSAGGDDELREWTKAELAVAIVDRVAASLADGVGGPG